MGTTSFLSSLLFLLASNYVHHCNCVSFPSATIQPSTETISTANSDFAVRLNFALGTPGLKNTFFSPYSISSAMGMVYSGASGKTASEIAKTFNFGYKNDVQSAYQTFYNAINAPGKEYSLSTANGLFVQSGFNLLESYKIILSNYYHAAAKELNFIEQSEPSRLEINRWVESQTQNMIKELFQPGTVTSDTRLVLANAIYFKGTWKTMFSAELTKQEPFKPSDIESEWSAVPMMNVVSKFNIKHVRELEAKVLQLPYSGNDLSMLIFLPNQNDGLPKMLSLLKTRHFSTEGMREMKVTVKLPKFKLETEINLKDVLQSMGVRDLFTTSADIRISEEQRLKVDTAVHKAVIEVDEEGTTAAAATGFGMVAYSLADFEEPMYFYADHPFAFAIIHKPTSGVLFFGTYSTPTPGSPVAQTIVAQQRPVAQPTLRPRRPTSRPSSSSFGLVTPEPTMTTCPCVPRNYFKQCLCELGPTPAYVQRTQQDVRPFTRPNLLDIRTDYGNRRRPGNKQQVQRFTPTVAPPETNPVPWPFGLVYFRFSTYGN